MLAKHPNGIAKAGIFDDAALCMVYCPKMSPITDGYLVRPNADYGSVFSMQSI
jgi:hypothetical protein